MAAGRAIYQKEWRDKNPGKASKYSKEWRERNKEKVKKYRRDNYSLENSRIRRKTGQFLLAQAKKRAKDRQLPFNITIEDIIIPEFCPVLGIRLAINTKRPGDSSPSLDKTIPKLGYIKGNIDVISWRANQIKTNATLNEIEKLFYYLKNKKEQFMNPDSDKIYGILRDLTNGAITIENAFARIKGLTDASELEADSYNDDQKSELNETDEQEEAVIDRPDVAVQVVQNPASGDASPNGREIDDTEKAQEEAEVEEKPKSRRKKKTTDDETDTTTTDK